MIHPLLLDLVQWSYHGVTGNYEPHDLREKSSFRAADHAGQSKGTGLICFRQRQTGGISSEIRGPFSMDDLPLGGLRRRLEGSYNVPHE